MLVFTGYTVACGLVVLYGFGKRGCLSRAGTDHAAISMRSSSLISQAFSTSCLAACVSAPLKPRGLERRRLICHSFDFSICLSVCVSVSLCFCLSVSLCLTLSDCFFHSSSSLSFRLSLSPATFVHLFSFSFSLFTHTRESLLEAGM